MDTQFRNFERQYWQLARKLDLLQYIIPQNLTEAKSRFLKGFSTGRPSDPIFSYRPLVLDCNAIISELQGLKDSLSTHENPLIPSYKRLIEEDIDCLTNLADRRCGGFRDWLANLYGFPTKEEVQRANELLAGLEHPIQGYGGRHADITPTDMKLEVEKHLMRLGIRNWQVVIENSSARITVNPLLQRITLNKDSSFALKEKKRLIVHEIGVHVVRSLNGSKQPFIIFGMGFPNYLMTEEGLALLCEKRASLLDDQSLIKYCYRLIVTHYCRELGFVGCFEKIRGLLPDADSFDIVARVKRGLLNTADVGGFTKDQIYLKGLWKVEQLHNNDIQALFVGKIGIDDLSILPQIQLIRSTNYPDWVTLTS
jgi:hypothetical protein